MLTVTLYYVQCSACNCVAVWVRLVLWLVTIHWFFYSWVLCFVFCCANYMNTPFNKYIVLFIGILPDRVFVVLKMPLRALSLLFR